VRYDLLEHPSVKLSALSVLLAHLLLAHHLAIASHMLLHVGSHDRQTPGLAGAR
jgi:hypothetical protein